MIFAQHDMYIVYSKSIVNLAWNKYTLTMFGVNR